MKKTSENNQKLPQNLFLTMSYQSDAQKLTNDITKEELEAYYKTVLGESNIISMEIVKEHHKDGNAHFHIHIKCSSRLKRKFKQLYYMGNVVRVEQQKGNDEQVKKYLSKEDKEPLTVETPPLVKEIIPYKLHDRLLNIPFIFDDQLKKKHYWIWSSDADYGKTYLMKQLTRQYPKQLWQYNTEEKFQNGISPLTQIVIVDAAYDLKWKVLEKMCDNTYQFPIKSEDPVVLQHPCIILYLGNMNPYEVYACDDNQFDLKKKDRRKYIDARFNIIQLDPLSIPYPKVKNAEVDDFMASIEQLSKKVKTQAVHDQIKYDNERPALDQAFRDGLKKKE